MIGLILFFGEIIIRVQAIRTFGRFFQIDSEFGDHRLVIIGIYRYLRHPVCAGILLSVLGLPLLLSSALGFLVMLLFFLPIIYKINVEEKMLITKIG